MEDQCYADSLMLSATYEPFMLIVIMLSVILLSVVLLSVLVPVIQLMMENA
jgi:hypothetical protein